MRRREPRGRDGFGRRRLGRVAEARSTAERDGGRLGTEERGCGRAPTPASVSSTSTTTTVTLSSPPAAFAAATSASASALRVGLGAGQSFDVALAHHRRETVGAEHDAVARLDVDRVEIDVDVVRRLRARGSRSRVVDGTPPARASAAPRARAPRRGCGRRWRAGACRRGAGTRGSRRRDRPASWYPPTAMTRRHRRAHAGELVVAGGAVDHRARSHARSRRAAERRSRSPRGAPRSRCGSRPRRRDGRPCRRRPRRAPRWSSMRNASSLFGANQPWYRWPTRRRVSPLRLEHGFADLHPVTLTELHGLGRCACRSRAFRCGSRRPRPTVCRRGRTPARAPARRTCRTSSGTAQPPPRPIVASPSIGYARPRFGLRYHHDQPPFVVSPPSFPGGGRWPGRRPARPWARCHAARGPRSTTTRMRNT